MVASWSSRLRSHILAGERLERAVSSQRFCEGRFFNTSRATARLKSHTLQILGEYLFSVRERVPRTPLPIDDPRASWLQRPDSKLRVTWLGHSTMLIETGGIRVLTDPVFGERVSPLQFAGPKRFHPVPARILDLPKLDAVIVSHDHYDHLCYSSILELARRDVPFITSLGVGARLESWGIPAKRILELDWWEQQTLAGGLLRLTATPSQHFSGRGIGDHNMTAWSGWVIESDYHKLFFSGDTGLTSEFQEIGRRLGPFDLVMLEIGAFHPSWGDIHLGPDNALAALKMLGGGVLLPVHWGTFNLAMHAWDEPAETLWHLAVLDDVRLLTPRLGRQIEPVHIEQPDPWWRDVQRRR